MKKNTGFIILILCFPLQIYSQTASELIKKMIDEESKITTLKVTMVMNERIDGKMKEKKGDFKISYSPFKLYMKQAYPQKGMELLYIENSNNNKALINTNTFPWVTLSLNPSSKTMRKGYHHPIQNSGYRYFTEIVQYMINKNYHKLDEFISYNGIKTISGFKCHQVIYSNPAFGYFDYQATQSVSLSDLAKKFFVNDYMLIEKNPGKVDFDEVKTGRTIKIPNDYGKKVIINIDVNSYLPRSMHVFDEKGLFQEYFYSNILINPYFSSKDFRPDNNKYNF